MSDTHNLENEMAVIAKSMPDGLHVISSNTVPEPKRPPIAFIDATGHVQAHPAGHDLMNGITYIFTREELMDAMAEADVRHAKRKAPIADQAPDLTVSVQSLQPKLTNESIKQMVTQSSRDMVAALAQFNDPRGAAVVLP